MKRFDAHLVFSLRIERQRFDTRLLEFRLRETDLIPLPFEFFSQPNVCFSSWLSSSASPDRSDTCLLFGPAS